MALNFINCAANISQDYQSASGINAGGLPSGGSLSGSFAGDFAFNYNEYAIQGLVPGVINTGGNIVFLENAIGNITVQDLAQAFANYWATVAVTPGAPAHGGTSVASVVNDAIAKTALFENAINASITSTESTPWFQSFIENIEVIAVSNIIWTVTEIMPPNATPTPFPEGIT